MRFFRLRALSLAVFLVLPGLFGACTKVKLNNVSKPAILTELGLPSFVILSVSPAHGSIAGGTQVTITGNAFRAGATVTFGDAACLNVVVVNSTTLTCTTPAHPAGTLNVVIAPPLGSAATLPLAYSYILDPTSTGGYAITNGGGISTGGGIMLQAAIGEVGQPNIQTSANVQALSGVHGALWTP